MNKLGFYFCVGACVLMSGCTAQKAFPSSVRAGDTVTLPLGWSQTLKRQEVTVVITGSDSITYTYPPGDSAVRALAHVFPDPLSRLVVGTETNQALGVNANIHGAAIESQVTDGDKDISQAMLMLNLPSTLAVGTASIVVKNASDTSVTGSPIFLNVIPGAGSPSVFQQNGTAMSLSSEMISTLERAPATSVSFSGPTIPYGIQIELSRDSGVGKPWVANPRGDIKTVNWSDDGSRVRVLITPSNGVLLSNISHFKFYVAGGVTGLAVVSVKAFDQNGNAVTDLLVDLN